MIVDGKIIAAEILGWVRQTVAEMKATPHLTVFTCAPNFETRKFLTLKQKRAQEVGILVEIVEFAVSVTTNEVIQAITAVSSRRQGIVIQLPFPPTFEMDAILAAVPTARDIDVSRYDGAASDILPPVIGAIDTIAINHNVSWVGQSVVVIGNGRLVGAPAALYAQAKGAHVTVVTKDTPNMAALIGVADILILGAGVPDLVTAAMVKPGVVIFDAGTSEAGGMLVGDAASDVGSKAALITPVPGGIGPITIAVLLRNLVLLTLRR
jgi:methylenetetrahydrofolate dehydrogenase (NADP+)/methenyltetrahydrofolate cyclohydrolase